MMPKVTPIERPHHNLIKFLIRRASSQTNMMQSIFQAQHSNF
jgi:hypothetical protein